MSEMQRIMTAKPGTVFVDKYSGVEFTTQEISTLIVPMMRTDSKEEINRFCERFIVKDAAVRAKLNPGG